MKKILSLILALSLIISVAPMSFAAGTEVADDEPGMHFRFSAANWNKDATADISAADIKENGDGTSPAFASANTDPWYIDGQRLINDYRLTSGTPDEAYPQSKPNALYWSVLGTRSLSPISSTGSVSVALALRVELNETGVFTPSITYEAGPTSTKYAFFLAPVSAYEDGYTFYWKSASATETTKLNGDINITNQKPLANCYKDGSRDAKLIELGEQNFYESAEDEEKETAYFLPVQIEEPGEYYLYIAANGKVNKIPSIEKEDTYNLNLYSIDFEPMPKETADAAFTAEVDTDYTEAPETASVKTLALYGETSDVIKENIAVPYGESTNVDAVQATVTREDGTYNFLYWAKGLENGVGNKHIISTSNESFSYKPHAGNNYLIAVYEKAGAKKEAAFYDRNGQLLNLEITDNKLPTLPAMAGLGDAIGWEQLGTGKVFEAEADVSALEGDKVFMAKYNKLSENIAISINGVSNNYAYGDPVECKIDEAKKDSFSYWFKTINGEWGQIVSLDETYTFNAWEPCTVTAVYNGNVELANPRKIVLSTFSVGDNLTAVMAEFIGFDGAKEKGIMFGTKKIAMTTDYAQFTVTNDTTSAVTVTGYAIVDNTKYVDGEVTVAAAK